MDPSHSLKKLQIPPGWQAPDPLLYEHLTATLLNEKDLQQDLEAVNSSRDIIRRTRGGSWPPAELTEDSNLRDLQWHARESKEGGSFAYAVRNADGDYIGCFYLYPLGARGPVTEKMSKYDVDANWWVTTEAYERGDYEVLYRGLKGWLKNELGAVGRPWWSNAEIPA
ncbi:hypothetical protein SLS60_005414 [Paraconiothyrium brasiliense]|uniref:N-acetyltransferase domain-containing protein n=1 Tax=Paraconiothyrium brasiliense TaxID=300254 RepID=A0ABR3RHZ3_9PLEO